MSKLHKDRKVEQHIGVLEISRVVRSGYPLTLSNDPYAFNTIGQMIDERIVEEIKEDNEISSITVHLSEESRAALVAMYQYQSLAAESESLINK